MKSSKKPWPLLSAYGIKDRINTNPDFQRPAVWSRAQKQLLVDTILRDYDIPKLYWRKVSTKPDKYDVVDGQQRLRAIWGFFDRDFPLPKNAESIEGEIVANLYYDQLPDDLRRRFDVYALDIVILEESDEDEVREMFLRLQNGTSLKAQEKRNAYPGQMRAFVRQLVGHKFFQSVDFTNARFNHDLVAAQMVCLELAGEPANIKSADLDRMYVQYTSFDTKSPVARAVQRTLTVLAETFPEKTPELERFNVISLYCVVSEMQKQYAFEQVRPLLHDWFLAFEIQRRAQDQKSDDEVDPEWATYKEKISHSTDAADSIRWRMEFMLRHLLERFPAIQRKDNQRGFTRMQRLAVFRRDKGHCQLKIKCDGVRLTWDDWHCDHTFPWTAGGKTTVENARVACTACNLSKGDSLPPDDMQVDDYIQGKSLEATSEMVVDYPYISESQKRELTVPLWEPEGKQVAAQASPFHKSIASAPKSAKTGLIVRFQDGTVVSEDIAADTFAAAIGKLGFERVSNLGLMVNNFPLISKQSSKDYTQREIDGYFVMTHSNTQSKRALLLKIAAELREQITVDVVSA